MRSLEFDPAAFEDLAWWVRHDRKKALRMKETNVTAAQDQRRITADYHEATSSKSQHAQEHAAQIHNHVVECRQQLEQALWKPS